MADRFRFGRFELQRVERRLLLDGVPVRLGARAFDVLLALIDRHDRLVPKAELLDVVWPGLVVEEANVQVQVSALRKALGPDCIATIPGLGYRLTLALADGADDVAAAPAMAAGAAPVSRAIDATDLPYAPDPLIGRDEDLAALNALLRAHRLVTVVGAGGIGKTRLALAACRALADGNPRSIAWADLSALSAGESIVPAIAKAAAVSLGHADTLSMLVGVLSHRALLLVLDNCEHLAADVAAVVKALLRAADRLQVLATSQAPLRLQGERVYPLMPLTVPASGSSLAQARQCGALGLLESRASAADWRFAITEANLAPAIELCRQLDGVPLAIEMAAARLPLLGLTRLKALLGDRLDLLRQSSRDVPARQKSLRLTLEWSHSLLGDDEKAVLRRLAVFIGSCRLEVVQWAAALDGMDEWDVLEALSGLVDKSLVKLVDRETPRYRLLETTRLHALEKLALAAEADVMRRRHGQAMARLAEHAIESPQTDSSSRWLNRYLPDYDDLQLAFDQACERQDAEVASSVVTVLRRLDALRGSFFGSARRVEQAHRLLPHASPMAQARLHTFIASCGWVTTPMGTRLASARQAANLWRALGNPRQLHGALAIAATESARVGEHERAAQALAEARAIEQSSWPAATIAVRLLHEGWTALCSGDTVRHQERMREAMLLCDRSGEGVMANVARVELASAMLSANAVDESVALSRTAVQALRNSVQADYLGLALRLLCEGLLMQGDLPGARAAALEALPIAEQDTTYVWDLLRCVAVLASAAGHNRGAARLLGAVMAGDSREFPDPAASAGRVVAPAWAAIEAACGDEKRRLLDEGSRLGPQQACRVAQELLH